MKLLTIILNSLLIFGCSHIEIPEHETFVMSFRYQPETGKMRCRKTPFIFSKEKVGKTGVSENVDLSECLNLTGFKTDSPIDEKDFSSLRAWIENIFDIAEDSNQGLFMPQVDLDF